MKFPCLLKISGTTTMKTDHKIIEIPRSQAVDFIQRFHYSPVMPRITKHYLGFYFDGEMKAILTLGWGTQPRQTINKMFEGLTTKHYYEIGKMCIDDAMPKNTGSQILSSTISWMKKNTDKLFLYTLADGIMGKCGYVYQATNFHFGEGYNTHTYLMGNGERLHIRSANQLLIQNQALDNEDKPFGEGIKKRIRLSTEFMKDNNIRIIDGMMFRYIYPLNKEAKKLMKNGSTLNWNKDYPKYRDLVWMDTTDKKNKTKIDQPSFSFDEIKHNKITPSVGSTLDDFF